MSKKSAKVDFPGGNVALTWSRDLKSACATDGDEAWNDIGRAVVLLSEDHVRAQNVAGHVAEAASMAFIVLDEDGVSELPDPEILCQSAPALVWLEPSHWLCNANNDDSPELAERIAEVQNRLVSWIRTFNPAFPLVLVTAAPSSEAIADQLLVPGLFDRCLRLPKPTLEQLGGEFLDDLGREICSPALCAAPAKVGKLVQIAYDDHRQRDLALVYLQRRSRRAQKQLEFTDLMYLYTHGPVDEGDEPVDEGVKRSVAVHEAGHALVAIVDSGGCNVPDFCSVIPGADFGGIMVPSLSHRAKTDELTTYADFRHRIRTSLGGRAAEELAYGPEGVSTGAGGDLAGASDSACGHFGRCGFSPSMTTHDQSASNLAVIIGEPSPSEYAHVESLVRHFLDQEYRYVYKLLEANRPLLDAITERLMWDPIVDQSELETICKELRVI